MMRRGDNPTNHFPNMMGENYKLGSGAQGLTSQSQQIMKDFLLDQGVWGDSSEDRRRRELEKGDRRGEERGGAGASQPHKNPKLESAHSIFLLDCGDW